MGDKILIFDSVILRETKENEYFLNVSIDYLDQNPVQNQQL